MSNKIIGLIDVPETQQRCLWLAESFGLRPWESCAGFATAIALRLHPFCLPTRTRNTNSTMT